MVASSIACLVIGSGLSTFIHLRRLYHSEQMNTELQQNVRFALDSVVRDIRSAGYGLDVPDSSLGKWVDWIEQFDRNPQIVEGVGGSPDALRIVGAFNKAVTALSQPAATGDTSIVVEDAGKLNRSYHKLLFLNQAETVRITHISGNILSISSHPTESDRGLRYDYPAGAPIELVVTVEYTCRPQEGSILRHPYLARVDSSASRVLPWMQVTASCIEDLQCVREDDAITIEITGRTSGKNYAQYDQEHLDYYRRLILSSSVRSRNAM